MLLCYIQKKQWPITITNLKKHLVKIIKEIGTLEFRIFLETRGATQEFSNTP